MILMKSNQTYSKTLCSYRACTVEVQYAAGLITEYNE